MLTRPLAWPAFPALFALAACGATEILSIPSVVTVDASADAGGAAARTLATCETRIADGVPAFYRTYFKCVTLATSGDGVAIATESLPPHPTNYYGAGNANYVAFDTSRGTQYRANPNTLRAQAIKLTIPNTPVAKGLTVTAAMVDGVVGTSREEYPMGPAGVALDSVALFNPLAAPGDDIENEKYTFDTYNAHPAPDLTYHYHTASKGPLEVLVAIGAATSATPGAAGPELYGIMCDGTAILGCAELDGAKPAGALDAQGGHVHDVRDAKGAVALAARYHTHVCPSEATGHRYTPEIQYYSTCAR